MIVFPPSCNWKLSCAVSISPKSNAVVYASLSKLVLCTLDKTCFLVDTNGSRVTAVCFVTEHLLGVGASDGTVTLWSHHSGTLVKTKVHYSHSGSSVSAMGSIDDMLFSSDRKGRLISWVTSTGELRTLMPGSGVPLISLSVYTTGYLLGYDDGAVMLLSPSGSIVRMIGHEGPVMAVGHNAHGIASIGLDGAKIWNPDGTLKSALSISGKGKKGNVCLVWVGEHLVITGFDGSVWMHHFGVGDGFKFRQGHSRVIFSAVCSSTSGTFVTYSMDRNVIVWDSIKRTLLFKITGIGGIVRSIAANPSSGILAISSEDGGVRLCNTKKQSNVKLIWKGIQGYVTAISWNSGYPHILGFGTENGQVGMYDTRADRLLQTLCFHNCRISELVWVEDTPGGYVEFLYSLSTDGTIQRTRLEKGKLVSCETLTSIIHENVLGCLDITSDVSNAIISTFCFHSSTKEFAFGFSNGVVLISSNILVPVMSHHSHTKPVTSLSWNLSTLCSSSLDSTACVYNLRTSQSVLLPDKGFHSAAMHVRITDIGIVVAYSNGDLCIWDSSQSTCKPVKTISQHMGGINAIELSPWSESNIVYTGGDDQCLRLLDLSADFRKPRLPDCIVETCGDPPALNPSHNQKVKSTQSVKTTPKKPVCLFSGFTSVSRSEACSSLLGLLSTPLSDNFIRTQCLYINDIRGNALLGILRGYSKRDPYLECWAGNYGRCLAGLAESGRIDEFWAIVASRSGESSMIYCLDALIAQKATFQLDPRFHPHRLSILHILKGADEAAVKSYCTYRLYEEAIALIKLRWDSLNHLMDGVMLEWAAEWQKRGMLEQAAKCLLSSALYFESIGASDLVHARVKQVLIMLSVKPSEDTQLTSQGIVKRFNIPSNIY